MIRRLILETFRMFSPPPPFFLSALIFFLYWHVFIYVRFFIYIYIYKAVPIALTPQALTQYSADNDREGERLGRDVEGNDNARAEFIH